MGLRLLCFIIRLAATLYSLLSTFYVLRSTAAAAVAERMPSPSVSPLRAPHHRYSLRPSKRASPRVGPRHTPRPALHARHIPTSAPTVPPRPAMQPQRQSRLDPAALRQAPRLPALPLAPPRLAVPLALPWLVLAARKQPSASSAARGQDRAAAPGCRIARGETPLRSEAGVQLPAAHAGCDCAPRPPSSQAGQSLSRAPKVCAAAHPCARKRHFF